MGYLSYCMAGNALRAVNNLRMTQRPTYGDKTSKMKYHI